VFVSEEEHEGDGIVEFVHLFEVGYLIEIADVNDGEVLDTVGNACIDIRLAGAFREDRGKEFLR
jgi:hypothetical protein